MDPPSALQRTMSSSRTGKVQPIEVQQILTGTGAMAAKPRPVEHVTSPTSSTHSTGSSGRLSFQGHGGNTFVAHTELRSGVASRTNRFSTSFPVQRPGVSSPTRVVHSPTREMAPSVVPESLASPTGPTDTNYLTAIATQERRVLELKEELQRAEADLTQLKKQWALHEANKKRNDARRVTKLQPVQTTPPAVNKEEDVDGSNVRMQQEMERRKAFLHAGRNSNRTVFSGSRHTRTLSLLSPTRENGGDLRLSGQPQQSRPGSLPESNEQSHDEKRVELQPRPRLLARASTTPDLTTEVAQTANPTIDLPDNLEKGLDHDILLRTGKKMASDLKVGLWTFLEDLRQATVGDEATQHETVLPPLQMRKQTFNRTLKGARKSSKSSLRPSSRGSTVSGKSVEITKRPSPSRKHTKVTTQGPLPDLANPGFWTEHGITAPEVTPVQPMKKSPTIRRHMRSPSSKAQSATSPDVWDNWDDGSRDSRSSSIASEAAPATLSPKLPGPTSPRPCVEKKDPIPWPALSKLGPATLRRTASHLMSEWEKSLTPSPGREEITGRGDYLGLGAEAAATSIGRKTV